MLDYVNGYVDCAKEDGRWGSIDAWIVFNGIDINVYDGEGERLTATVYGLKDGYINTDDVLCDDLFTETNI
jgi:hypothetical protein